ncbi:MAG: hypothetical protein ACT4PL_05490 [Phycisphaerales bacterium]
MIEPPGNLRFVSPSDGLSVLPEGGRWRVLKSTATRWVGVADAEPGGVGRVVLKAAATGGVLGMVRRALGHSPLDRERRGAGVLGRAGLGTAAVLGHGTCTLQGRGAEFLLMEFVAGATLLEMLTGAGGRASPRGVCAVVAETIVRMVRAGWFNRDFKPSNLIIIDDEGEGGVGGGRSGGGALRVVQIDCAGIRRCDPRRLDHAPVRMLTALMLEPTGCGVALPMRARVRMVREVIRAWNEDGTGEAMPGESRAAGIRMLMRLVEERITRHGDATPRDNPLARSGR